MNDIRGGRVTSYMDDFRYSAVAEFRGGQVPGSNKLGQRPKGASWEIITRSHSHFTTLLPTVSVQHLLVAIAVNGLHDFATKTDWRSRQLPQNASQARL
jgi:hypothetical protein